MTALKQTWGPQSIFSAFSKSWLSFTFLLEGSPELEGNLYLIKHLKMVLGWSRKVC